MKMADTNRNVVDNINNLNERKNFVCGVVEGFYGRPWTPEQRKDLFSKQQKWGMNCYLYAPKDDYKHRANWRELYTVEEAEHLTALITEARVHGVAFFYAISPGLDITYSSQKEVSALKRKLEQVAQLGCNAFAILFDDIDPEMSGADKEVFHSFAHAQVSVANEVFTHLSQPKFMFCPTQYCSTRAVPNVQTSEYLNTIGQKLAPEIDIMWTGPKVISKILSVEHIREVTEVMRRPPVIWDNLHANDYDQARLFLGPYCGRSPDLIPLLRGVVTNPNCEYGPNFIAIHTLAQWSRSSTLTSCDNNDAVSADIRLETEGDDSSDDCPTGLSPNTYHPRRALRMALQDWLAEFNHPVAAIGTIQQPQIPTPVPILPSVNTCMALTSTTLATPGLPQPNINILAEVVQDTTFNPTMNPVMNSLVSENKVIVETIHEEADTASTVSQDASSTSGVEPMDCNPSPATSPPHNEDSMMIENGETSKVENEDDNTTPLIETTTQDELTASVKTSLTLPLDSTQDNSEELTVDDLHLLADLFYLPFEHGRQGINIMNEFNWLKINSHLVIDYKKNGEARPEVQEWVDRAARFDEMAKNVKRMANRLNQVKNRSLLYDIYPYIWDMNGVISLLNSYVKWLGFSKGWREVFMSGDQEPWIFRGGLTAELQRLIPVDASNDLFVYKAPEVPTKNSYCIRPYLPEDRPKLYSLILRTSDDRRDGTTLYAAHPDLPGDLAVGSYLEALKGEGMKDVVVMVVEDEWGDLVAYSSIAGNAMEHNRREAVYRESIRDKYPKVIREEGMMLTPCEELLVSLASEPQPPPKALVASHPIAVSLSCLFSLNDESISKRLLTCMLASVRARGMFAGHCSVSVGEKNNLELYSRHGFLEVTTQSTTLYLGRSF
ncbi:protein O-GlcNAcase-like isoform X2 [Homarus americanus]|uniref:protein O-GlcNAcase-like isoform X2 n=1 Tax=Homarus americanus TaxID=6706 RepID=UPI001C4771F0|nr:protein O-GlcNAcase-like isoform X2 [Homarus americanus]